MWYVYIYIIIYNNNIYITYINNIYIIFRQDILDFVRIKFKSDTKYFINYLQNLQR